MIFIIDKITLKYEVINSYSNMYSDGKIELIISDTPNVDKTQNDIVEKYYDNKISEMVNVFGEYFCFLYDKINNNFFIFGKHYHHIFLYENESHYFISDYVDEILDQNINTLSLDLNSFYSLCNFGNTPDKQTLFTEIKKITNPEIIFINRELHIKRCDTFNVKYSNEILYKKLYSNLHYYDDESKCVYYSNGIDSKIIKLLVPKTPTYTFDYLSVDNNFSDSDFKLFEELDSIDMHSINFMSDLKVHSSKYKLNFTGLGADNKFWFDQRKIKSKEELKSLISKFMREDDGGKDPDFYISCYKNLNSKSEIKDCFRSFNTTHDFIYKKLARDHIFFLHPFQDNSIQPMKNKSEYMPNKVLLENFGTFLNTRLKFSKNTNKFNNSQFRYIFSNYNKFVDRIIDYTALLNININLSMVEYYIDTMGNKPYDYEKLKYLFFLLIFIKQEKYNFKLII